MSCLPVTDLYIPSILTKRILNTGRNSAKAKFVFWRIVPQPKGWGYTIPRFVYEIGWRVRIARRFNAGWAIPPIPGALAP
jgi:hypothetical protein